MTPSLLRRSSRIAVLGSALALLTMPAAAMDASSSAVNEIRTAIAVAGAADVIVTARDAASAAQQVTSALTLALAADGIDVEQTFANLAMALVRVDAGQLEALLDDNRIAAVYLNRPRRLRRASADPVRLERAQSAPALQLSAVSPQERAMKADAAWQAGATGRDQVVVVISNGIDRHHDAFRGRIQTAACFSPRFSAADRSMCPGGAAEAYGSAAASNCPGDESALEDLGRACGLGTHEAAVIAGLSPFVRGVAFDAGLIPIQVYTSTVAPETCGSFDPCLVTYESAVLNALDAAVNFTVVYPIAAVELDVVGANARGTCDDDVLKPAIDRLRTLGILTIVPAGDAGEIGTVGRPACVSTALTASTASLADPFPLSNHGPIVDLLAPGERVFSAWPGNDYDLVSGTGAAAAHLAGAVAILKSARPGATASEIEAALKAGGVPVRASGWTWTTPRLDVFAALQRLEGANPSRGVAITGVRASASVGAKSYVRLHNADTIDAPLTATVVDEATGATLGVWSKAISLQTSPQISVASIETDAVPPIMPVAGRTYTLYIDAPFAGHVQHVTWDPATGVLANATACSAGPSTDTRSIINVHTSLLARYPSSLQITNFGAAATPSFAVTDARTSAQLGTYRMPHALAPGQTETFGVSDVVESLGYSPYATQYHVEMQLDPGFTGSVRHLVFNDQAGVVSDLTAKCDF